MSLTISHSHEEGTLVAGTARGDGSAPVLKRFGFRWSRNLGAWYVPQSRDRFANTSKIDAAAAGLREAGFTVDVEVDDAPRAAADRYADQAERSAARAEALDAKAEKLDKVSDQRLAAERRILDGIPFGQPILVGHHSERRHRRDIDKAETNRRKGMEAYRESQDAARRADAARSTAARAENPAAIKRKITRLETERRDIDRKLDRLPAERERYPQYAANYDTYEPRIRSRRDQIIDEVAFLNGQLEELGARQWGPGDFKPGDYVKLRGRWELVVKVNPKTLAIDASILCAGHTLKYSYDDVQDRRSAAEAAAG